MKPTEQPTLGAACAAFVVIDEAEEDAEHYRRRLAEPDESRDGKPRGLQPVASAAEQFASRSLGDVAREMSGRSTGRTATPADRTARLMAWLVPDSFGDVLLEKAAHAAALDVGDGAPASASAQALGSFLAAVEPIEARVQAYRRRLGIEPPPPDDDGPTDPRGLIDALVEAGHGSRAEVEALPFQTALEINARMAQEAQRARKRLQNDGTH